MTTWCPEPSHRSGEGLVYPMMPNAVTAPTTASHAACNSALFNCWSSDAVALNCTLMSLLEEATMRKTCW